MNLSSFIGRFKYKAFLLALLTLRFPPVYILPPIKSAFLTTQSIARIVFLGLFVWEIYLLWKGKGGLEKFIKKNKILVVLLFVFLFELSLGVLYAQNVKGFLLRYKDVYLGFVLFFLGGLYLRELEGFAKVVGIGLVLSLFYQALIFFAPDFFKTLAGVFIYDRHLGLVSDNIERGRIYIETFDEALFLVFLAWLVKKYPKRKNALATFLFAVVGFFALVSNFRTRILIWGVSLVGYLFYEAKKRLQDFNIRKLIFLFLAVFLLMGLVAETLSLKIYGFSYIDRLAFKDKREDVQTVFFRIDQIKDAWDMSKANLYTGVGLGNFFENLSFTKVYSQFYYLERSETVFGAAEYVHNIFGTFLAEGGVIASLIFFALTAVFIKYDWMLYKKKEKENILLITAFWGVYIYALLHPFVPLSLQGVFWLLRGMLTART